MMLRWFRVLAAWETVRDTGVTVYQWNRISGKRRIFRRAGGHQPVDWGWKETGDWTKPGPPPNIGSGVTDA